jgi:hypothetical protein
MRAISYSDLCQQCLNGMVLDDMGIVLDNGGPELEAIRKELLESLRTRIRFIDQFEPLYQTYTFGLDFRLENRDLSLKPVPRISVLRDHVYKIIDIDIVPTIIINHYVVLRSKIELWQQGYPLLLTQALPAGFEEYYYESTTTTNPERS